MPKTIDAVEKAYNPAVEGALLALEGEITTLFKDWKHRNSSAYYT